jgi:uridine kinase
MKAETLLIGIGGVSRSGKSTLARQLQEHYASMGKSCLILSQDDFVIPEDQIPKIRDRIDWEDPVSIDWKQLKRKIEEMKASFQVIIVEGLFAFVDPALTELYDMKFFMEISKETFLARKAVDDRWGPEPDWFIEHIWESYLKYGKVDPQAQDFIFLNGEKTFNIALIKLPS